ncbi:hypothetical protein F2Q69_00038509 [Brassica cretica]|uniref:Uncharacterized protein n=1 Tax=Brassica cretica TaxID=69181 RepID=A0A8S9SSM2_BRACR|nr:hypothetical protein F2Q69_00038509 [Brassica cretica]
MLHTCCVRSQSGRVTIPAHVSNEQQHLHFSREDETDHPPRTHKSCSSPQSNSANILDNNTYAAESSRLRNGGWLRRASLLLECVRRENNRRASLCGFLELGQEFCRTGCVRHENETLMQRRHQGYMF